MTQYTSFMSRHLMLGSCIICALLLAGCETLDTKQSSFFSFTTHKARNPAPSVIVAHGCDGPNVWTEDWRKRLNSWGYNAVVVDQFKKRGFPTGLCERAGGLVPPDERNLDISELADWIEKQPWHRGRIGIIGMSHGGATVIDAAINPGTFKKFSAGVALYPGCMNVRSNYENPLFPVQVHLGKQDGWTPCLSSNWSNYESYVYENAGHSFDINMPTRRFAGYTLWFDSEATAKSQKRIREFLDKNLLR
jgi:dienelactone hydrolase